MYVHTYVIYVVGQTAFTGFCKAVRKAFRKSFAKPSEEPSPNIQRGAPTPERLCRTMLTNMFTSMPLQMLSYMYPQNKKGSVNKKSERE